RVQISISPPHNKNPLIERLTGFFFLVFENFLYSL
ncbi:MAG: hypothetical protein ACI9F1_002515, partial [Colwellia sp.]